MYSCMCIYMEEFSCLCPEPFRVIAVACECVNVHARFCCVKGSVCLLMGVFTAKTRGWQRA